MHHKPRLSRREARDYLATAHGIDYSIKYLGKITRDGTGPRAIYNGKRALYDVADLDAWVRSRLWEPEPRHHLDQPTPEQMEIARAQSAEYLGAARGFVMAEIERAKAGEPAQRPWLGRRRLQPDHDGLSCFRMRSGHGRCAAADQFGSPRHRFG